MFTLNSELVATQGNTAVARVEVVYAGSRQRTYRDLWVITLASDGRCRAFEEWPFYPEQALSPPEDTLSRAAADAIAAKAGLTEHIVFPLVVWSLAELQAGRERFEAAAGGFLSDSPVELRETSIDESRNLVEVGIAPELSGAWLRVLGQAIAAAGVPVQVSVQRGRWIAAAG